MTTDHNGGAGAVPAPSVVLDLGSAEETCGDPALGRVRRAWDILAPGAVLEVRSPIAEHRFAVSTWVQREGGELLSDTRDGGEFVLRLRRTA